MGKRIDIPGRLHSVATEGQLGGADEIFDDSRQKNQQQINDELYKTQERAEQAASQSEYYNELTREAIQSMTKNEQEVLEYSQAVVKHGRAITKIAQQLGATYNDEGREEKDEYTPGLTFELKEEAEMEYLIDNPSQAVENHLYIQLEPQEEDETLE